MGVKEERFWEKERQDEGPLNVVVAGCRIKNKQSKRRGGVNHIKMIPEEKKKARKKTIFRDFCQ